MRVSLRIAAYGLVVLAVGVLAWPLTAESQDDSQSRPPVAKSDIEIVKRAREERIIVTHDPDFLDSRRFPHHRNPGIVIVRPGSSGRDNRGLFACLIKATLIAGEHATWFKGRKLDFSSEEFLTITNQVGQPRFRWAKNRDLMVWED